MSSGVVVKSFLRSLTVLESWNIKAFDICGDFGQSKFANEIIKVYPIIDR